MDPALEQLLSPHLTPEQAALLRYERTLPAPTLAAVCERLRRELAALRTLVPPPLARFPADFAGHGGGHWEGSLLYADLSGFTALTEQLATAGRQGLEELSEIINRLFSALLAEIDRFGGFVLKFGGDSLTAFFGRGQIGEGHTAAACAAGLALQAAVAQFALLSTSAGAHPLRLRVGVHRGGPFCAVVGDELRRELFVTGHAVNRVAWLQERAAPGEVLVSPEALAALEAPRQEPRPAGSSRLLGLGSLPLVPPRPAPPELPAGADLATAGALAAEIAALRPFVPAALPGQVLYSAGRASGEFRPVSALFVTVASFSGLLALLEGAEELAARALALYYDRVQRVVRWYGGEVNKVDIGSGGDKLLALFGAPLAHEDDPLRAVEAALDLGPALEQANREIREMLAAGLGAGAGGPWRAVDLSLRQRIGVASGNAFAGAIGSPRRREYTAMGQTVNLAARLMAAAEPGAVLLAPATGAAVRGAVEQQPLAPLALKGLEQPVVASLALRRRRATPAGRRQVAPLVGREVELRALRELARQAQAGAGQVALVIGEPGVGKSRLAAAYLAEAGAIGMRSLAIGCRSYAQGAPYSLARDLVGRLIELPADDGRQAIAAALRQAISSLAPELVAFTPLLEALFGPAAPPGAPPAHGLLRRLPPSEQRERLYDLLVALVIGAAQAQPLALLVDDLHWADASSLEVIARLARAAPAAPLCLVLCDRVDARPGAGWLELPSALQLRLEALDEAGSRALLAHHLGEAAPLGLEPLLERAQGSPLFLEALVQHLLAAGVLRREPGAGWRLERLDEMSIPSTIEPLLAAQLDRLDEESRELVQVAAVIGTRISYAVLAGVYSQARQPARRLLALVQRGVLVSDGQDAQAPFRFRQTLLREVAYQGIAFARRRELHRRVAERIEQVFADQLDLYAAELAHHYQQAADWPRAYAFALRAARASAARFALPEALKAYEHAIGLAQEHGLAAAGEGPATMEELADLEVQAGRYERARLRYGELLVEQVAAGEGPGGRLAEVALRRKIGGVYEQQGLLDEALARLGEALEMLAGAKGPGAVAERGRLSSAIGWAHFRRGEADLARAWLEQALGAIEAGGASDALAERARVQNRLGGVAWMAGDLEAARRFVERSLADFTALGDLLGQADAQNNLGILAEQRGDWEGATASYAAALAANEQSGRRRAAAMSRLNLGAAWLQLGRPEAAVAALELAAGQMAEVGDALHEGMALRWLGRASLALGRLAGAAAALDRALALARAAEIPVELLDAQTALGELALARGDWPAARAALGAGWALEGQVEPGSLERGLFLRLAAELEGRAGDPGRAAELRAESRAILGGLGHQ